VAVHVLGLLKTHNGENCGCNVAKHAVSLLQAEGLRGVGHDEGNLVGGVRCLGRSLLCEHLLSVAVISSDEECVSALLALVVNLLDGLVGLCASLDSCLVDSSVADHVRWCEVVHEELKFASLNPLAELLGNSHGAHCGLEIIRRYLRRRNHLALLVLKLLLDTTVEEEGDVGVLLGLSDVALLDTLLSECLGEDIVHSLRRESNRECVAGVVGGHGGERDIGGVGEVGFGRAVEVTQQLGDLTDTVRAVVEEEDSVLVCMHALALDISVLRF
jgi:hypothetical protein